MTAMILSEMLDKTLSALLVAGFSGLTLVAYKHPRGYKKMFPFLHWGATIVFLIGCFWNVEAAVAFYRWSPFIPLDKYPAAQMAFDAQKISFLWLFVGYVGFSLFFWFLYYLPEILEKDRELAPIQEPKDGGNPPSAD